MDYPLIIIHGYLSMEYPWKLQTYSQTVYACVSYIWIAYKIWRRVDSIHRYKSSVNVFVVFMISLFSYVLFDVNFLGEKSRRKETRKPYGGLFRFSCWEGVHRRSSLKRPQMSDELFCWHCFEPKVDPEVGRGRRAACRMTCASPFKKRFTQASKWARIGGQGQRKEGQHRRRKTKVRTTARP